MKSFKNIGIAFAMTLLASAVSFAQLKEGSFKGNSNLIHNKLLDNDVMALLLKKDPSASDRYHAILAEYDRVPLTNVSVRAALTKWINRMYVYQVDKVTADTYIMKKLVVNNAGEIVTDETTAGAVLQLKKQGTMDGAVITRFENNEKAETVTLDGRVGSTWENMVVGKFFGTNANSGSDYFNKKTNTEIHANGMMEVDQEDIRGSFMVSEKRAGLFTISSLTDRNMGADKLTSRIAVFVDIVNWKHLGIEKFTTEELLLINPENASDVGFYYERH